MRIPKDSKFSVYSAANKTEKSYSSCISTQKTEYYSPSAYVFKYKNSENEKEKVALGEKPESKAFKGFAASPNHEAKITKQIESESNFEFKIKLMSKFFFIFLFLM